MPVPKLTVVTPEIKLLPVIVTSKVAPTTPVFGAMLDNCGVGLLMMKLLFNDAVELPGSGLLTETARGPLAAESVIVIFVVSCVSLFTVVELIVIPLPKLAVVAPVMKLLPVKTTSSVCRRLPTTGFTLVSETGGRPTVKPFVKVAMPPPGPALVTITSRLPITAFAAIERFTVICVALLIVVELTVMSLPKLTLEIPSIKKSPVNTTFKDWPCKPRLGALLVNTGAGLFTVKPFVSVSAPPPGVVFVMITSRGPSTALSAIVMFAVSCVALLIVVALTVISLPKLTLVTPAIKLLPFKTTSSVCKRPPLFGVAFVNTGAGLFTVKPFVKVALPPPGSGFVTVTSRAPSAAVAAIVIFAVSCVAESMVVVFTVMSLPKLTVVAPPRKFDPLTTTSKVCNRLPLLGFTLVIVNAGNPIVNPPAKIAVPPPGPAFVTAISRAPSAAFTPTVMFAVICVKLFTVVELIIISGPKSMELASA